MGSGQTKPKVQPVVRRLSRKENAKTKLGNAPSSDDGRDNVRTVLTPAPRHHLREALKTAYPITLPVPRYLEALKKCLRQAEEATVEPSKTFLAQT